MIIATQDDITADVLAELERSSDKRFKEIMSSAIRHLHAFIRETKLSEAEFNKACSIVAELGQISTASHNEVVLMAGSLGLSSLVCLINNGDREQTETTASLMGPFWRMNPPAIENGGSLVRSPTPGDPTFVDGWVRDIEGKPVEGAEVDVWHASPEGFYESQDPGQAEMNLRGKLTSDKDGHFWFHSVKPAGYPIPVHGPVGDLLRAQGRHNMRPAHIHFMIYKEGYKTQFSQVYSSDDPNLETDVQFGVTQTLVGNYVRHESERNPLGKDSGTWYSLEQNFKIESGETTLPEPPITGKAAGDRPEWIMLERKP